MKRAQRALRKDLHDRRQATLTKFGIRNEKLPLLGRIWVAITNGTAEGRPVTERITVRTYEQGGVPKTLPREMPTKQDVLERLQTDPSFMARKCRKVNGQEVYVGYIGLENSLE